MKEKLFQEAEENNGKIKKKNIYIYFFFCEILAIFINKKARLTES